ncbi:MAG: hypothetical protein O3A87_04445 [Verrucomicrobia bacterium]|nr:hypothetical protein [Verrucomicrobiota bacterium]
MNTLTSGILAFALATASVTSRATATEEASIVLYCYQSQQDPRGPYIQQEDGTLNIGIIHPWTQRLNQALTSVLHEKILETDSGTSKRLGYNDPQYGIVYYDKDFNVIKWISLDLSSRSFHPSPDRWLKRMNFDEFEKLLVSLDLPTGNNLTRLQTVYEKRNRLSTINYPEDQQYIQIPKPLIKYSQPAEYYATEISYGYTGSNPIRLQRIAGTADAVLAENYFKSILASRLGNPFRFEVHEIVSADGDNQNPITTFRGTIAIYEGHYQLWLTVEDQVDLPPQIPVGLMGSIAEFRKPWQK